MQTRRWGACWIAAGTLAAGAGCSQLPAGPDVAPAPARPGARSAHAPGEELGGERNPTDAARSGDAGSGVGASADAAVAWVDGEPIAASEAFRELLLASPDLANNAVRQLVLDRLAAAEAARRGIEVPQAVLARELATLLADQERKVREATKGERDLAGHARVTWGLDFDAYREIAAAELRRSLLLERVVLHELFDHPRVQLRLLRVKEQALAEEIARKLEQGADFAALARQHSEDGSARDGGLYPPLPSDLASPLFEQTASLEPGQRSPVHPFETPDGTRWRIVQLMARLPPDRGDAAARAAAVEQLLDGRALAPPELEAWMRIMEERHEIRFLGAGAIDERR